MRVKNPTLVTAIGDLNILSVIFITASFFPTPKFIEQFGLSFIPIHSISEDQLIVMEFLEIM